MKTNNILTPRAKAHTFCVADDLLSLTDFGVRGRPIRFRYMLPVMMALMCMMDSPAADGTWNGATGVWELNSNWSASPYPGATSGTTNTDTATFINQGVRNVNLSGYLNIQNLILNDTSSNYWEFKFGTLSITSGGTIQKLTGSSYVNIFSNMQINGTGMTVTSNGSFGLIGNISEGNAGAGITYIGTSGIQIDGQNSYTGGTVFAGGSGSTYVISRMANGGSNSSVGASSSAAANLVLNAGINFKYNGAATSTDRSFTIGTAGQVALHFEGGGALQFTSNAAVAYASPNFNFQLRLLGKNTGDNRFGLSLGDNGTGVTSVDKFDTAKVIFSGNNTYTGTTSIYGGILNIQSSTALGSTAGSTTIGTAGGLATLQLEGGISVGAEALNLYGAGAAGQNGAVVNVNGNNTYGGLVKLIADSKIASDAGNLAFTHTGTITGSGFHLTLAGAGTGSFASIIGTGSGSVTKMGTGTWALSGASTYSGSTFVSAGTLLVNNVSGSGTGSGSVSVSAGAALGGSGAISGATTISGSLRPGNSIGTLTVANDVTWNGGDAWVFELGTAATSLALANTGSSTQDMLRITGVSSDFLKGSGSSWTFDFAGTGQAGWYKLVGWEGITDFTVGNFSATNLGGGLTGTFTLDGATNALYLNVVPEPTPWLLFALSTMLLVTFRRRRQ